MATSPISPPRGFLSNNPDIADAKPANRQDASVQHQRSKQDGEGAHVISPGLNGMTLGECEACDKGREIEG